MRNQTAVIFPVIEVQPDTMYTTMQTNQLHRIPRTNATSHGNEHFAVAIATNAGPDASVPLL